MAVSMIGPKFYAWDRDGKPLAFGKLFTYQARTNVPKPTYQSEDQVVENTNPVILNGEGYADVYLVGSYKMVLKDGNDNEIWSSDPVSAAQATEWVGCVSATYLSATSFKVAGNMVSTFEVGRRCRIDNNTTEYSYSDIVSSVFAGGETTVTIFDPVVLTGIVNACVAIVGPDILTDEVISTGAEEPRKLQDRFADIGGHFKTKQDLIDRAGEVATGDTIKVNGEESEHDGLAGYYVVSTSNIAGSINMGDGRFANRVEEEYTILSEEITKISLQAKSFIRRQIIVTGDSLSFNGFGYPAGWPVSGSGYATDQPLGISPWSAILRDSIIAANSFQSIKDLKMVTNCDLLVPNAAERAYHAMNAVAMFLTPAGGVYDGTDSTTLVTQYSGGQGLLIGTRPSGTGASFDLNGDTISTDSTDGQNLGFGYKVIPFTPVSDRFCNIENIQGAPLTVYGIVPSDIKIPKITGKGAWTSTQILAEYDDLVAPYNPDVILYIIGANDASTDPETSGYNASVQSFIDRAKSDNPNVEIILISMPPTSSFSDNRIAEYRHAGWRMAVKNNCSHVDLYSELINYPVSDWRFDNIHCNTNGDTIWFNIFKQLLFPGLDVPEVYQPIREYFAFVRPQYYIKGDTFTCSVLLDPGSPTLVSTSGLEYNSKVKLEYGVEGGLSVCKVSLPTGYTLASIEPLILTNGQANVVRLNKNITDNVFTVVTVGVGNNTVVNPDGSRLYFLFTATKSFK